MAGYVRTAIDTVGSSRERTDNRTTGKMAAVFYRIIERSGTHPYIT